MTEHDVLVGFRVRLFTLPTSLGNVSAACRAMGVDRSTYGPPEDPDDFERYYAETHAPLATAMPGLRDSKPRGVIATPDGAAVPISASPSSRSRTWTRCRRGSGPTRARRLSRTSRTSPPEA